MTSQNICSQPKLFSTRLTFSDIQQKDSAKREVATDGEITGLNVPVIDLRHYPISRERRNARVINREHDPRAREVVGKVPMYERGDLP